MKFRLPCLPLAIALVAGCGFESNVQGDWKLDADTFKDKHLRRAGVPPELLRTFKDGVFVVDDGVVYVGAAHPDTALLKYSIGKVKDDCADVKLTAEDDGGRQETANVEACLDEDRLELRYDEGRKPVNVGLTRVSR